MVVILIVLSIIYIRAYTQTLTPSNALEKYVKGYSSEFAISEIIYQDTFDDYFVIFYINQNGNAACAILKKNFICYEVLDLNSEMAFSPVNRWNTIDQAKHIISYFYDDNIWKSIDWGIIYDKEVKEVCANDMQFRLVTIDPYDVRICYIIDDASDKPYGYAYIY